MAIAELESTQTLTPWQQQQGAAAQQSNQSIFDSRSDSLALELFFKSIKHLIISNIVPIADTTALNTKIDYLQSLCHNITPKHLHQMLRVQPVAFIADIESATHAEILEAYNRGNTA
jgi:hypothetical protein